MAKQEQTLEEYWEKRDFRASAEPQGDQRPSSDPPFFVIQKHDASNLHYDFRLEVWLDGEKIRGGYALMRTGSGNDARWLLIKMDDEAADARRNPTSTEPKSVLSGRTLEEIRAEEAS